MKTGKHNRLFLILSTTVLAFTSQAYGMEDGGRKTPTFSINGRPVEPSELTLEIPNQEGALRIFRRTPESPNEEKRSLQETRDHFPRMQFQPHQENNLLTKVYNLLALKYKMLAGEVTKNPTIFLAKYGEKYKTLHLDESFPILVGPKIILEIHKKIQETVSRELMSNFEKTCIKNFANKQEKRAAFYKFAQENAHEIYNNTVNKAKHYITEQLRNILSIEKDYEFETIKAEYDKRHRNDDFLHLTIARIEREL